MISIKIIDSYVNLDLAAEFFFYLVLSIETNNNLFTASVWIIFGDVLSFIHNFIVYFHYTTNDNRYRPLLHLGRFRQYYGKGFVKN